MEFDNYKNVLMNFPHSGSKASLTESNSKKKKKSRLNVFKKLKKSREDVSKGEG